MKKEEIMEILLKTSAILNGHFKLSSGLHSDTYVQCALVLKYPGFAKKLAEELCDRVSPLRADVIVSPAMGGIIIGWEVARILNIPFMFSEREDGVVKLRRGFSLKKNERVLIVEDVFTTGKSTLEVRELVESYNAIVAGACSIIKRGITDFDFPDYTLLELKFKTYKPGDCPMCRKNIPLIKPGSRK